MTLLSIKNLTVRVGSDGPAVVDRVSLDIPANRITALVGGSGSGKSTTALAVVRLLSSPLTVTDGEIRFDTRDLLKLPEKHMTGVRGRKIGFVFQEPLFAFDPLFTIGAQIDETLVTHSTMNKRERRERVIELLQQARIDEAERAANSYPHQLSGGLRQRAMIAQALSGHPKLLIADEPTSNLDVTIQAQIMELFRRLKNELGLAVLLITHDLGVVEHLADHVTVLSQGRVIESGPAAQVVQSPREEYTRKLVGAFRI